MADAGEKIATSMSLNQVTPTEFKTGHVIPLLKPGKTDTNNPASYRGNSNSRKLEGCLQPSQQPFSMKQQKNKRPTVFYDLVWTTVAGTE